MLQFQSLQRLLIFYGLTVLSMLALYYFALFHDVKEDNKEQSVATFYALQHEIIEHMVPLNTEIKQVLEQPKFADTSYQLIFMMPSGQTYIHNHARPNEPAFATVTFPTVLSPSDEDGRSHSTYTLNNRNLAGTIKLKSGHQVYIILRHRPLAIDWISYRYWLPLMAGIIFFIIALTYMLGRRTKWEQVLLYTDSLSSQAKETYRPPPFLHKKATTEFLYLGNALSRISYQLHSDYRRIKTLQHRLDRLVEQAPLPMLMIMRHGQISFFNQRFEQVFMSASQKDGEHELTDFVTGKDKATQQLLQTLSDLRLTRTLIVYGLQNNQVYQLHITPWFGEYGQVHGFTVLLNSIHELATQTEQLQQQNQQLQQKLDQSNQLQSLIGYQLRVPLEEIIDTLEPINPATLTVHQNDVLKSLINTSQSMLTTLHDTLGIEEVEVRKTRLNIESVDIYQLAQETSNLVISNIRQQGLELIYFFSPDCPRCIHTDDIRLRKTLLTLLENTITVTTSGYVALTVDCVTDAQIKQINSEQLLPLNENNENKVVEPSSHWVRFSIKDNDTSVIIDRQRQLLSDFDRNDYKASIPASDQTDQPTVATSFGLNDANSFAQLLGGFVEFTNNGDQGGVFNLYLPCRHPNYQPVYHRSPHFSRIHLIAIVNQPLIAEQLQQLCTHLSISASIHASTSAETIRSLVDKWSSNDQPLAPLLLLDYECYDAVATTVSTHTAHTSDNQQQALAPLFAYSMLPKILFSMNPERRIPSVLLDKFDSFLTKPLDMTLMFSEVLRLTLGARQKLAQTQPFEEQPVQSTTVVEVVANEATTPALAPLILVVEDSPTNQKITCRILKRLGYRSVVAEDGQQALDLLARQRQDILLILMDCRMPVMDGLQATRAIRAQGDDIPIVALTANNAAEDREACMQAGMDEFLTKPINKEALETALQSFIKA
ncbi:response regulator [Psychrobacter sp. B38]|uniref:response regulator n=1 Tax=Psychrobacter sp. B38 TaxID=3143538 RepID=UPI003210D81E